MLADPVIVAARHGLSVRAVTVLVDRADKLVARVDTERGAFVMKVDAVEGSLAREVAAIHRLGALDLPVPDVFVFEPGPAAYLIAAWIDGSALDPDSPPTAVRQTGELLRRIHRLGGGPPYAGNATWDAWMAGWLNHAASWWLARPGSDPGRGERLWRWFEGLRPLLATRGHDQILFDGRPDHVLVRDGRVSGLIDLSELRSGDAAMDLGVLCVSQPGLLPGILAGYRPDPTEQEAFDRLIPFYTFLRRVAHAEWHLTHGDPAVADHLLTLVDQAREP